MVIQDELVCSVEQIKSYFLHYIMHINGPSTLNGCRQNESKQLIKQHNNPHNFSL